MGSDPLLQRWNESTSQNCEADTGPTGTHHTDRPPFHNTRSARSESRGPATRTNPIGYPLSVSVPFLCPLTETGRYRVQEGGQKPAGGLFAVDGECEVG